MGGLCYAVFMEKLVDDMLILPRCCARCIHQHKRKNQFKFEVYERNGKDW
jgi:hypothetical protein